MPIKSFILKWDEPLGVALIAAIFAACLAENLYAVSTLMDTSVGTCIQYSVAVMIEALGLIKMREAFRNRKWAATGGMLFADGSRGGELGRKRVDVLQRQLRQQEPVRHSPSRDRNRSRQRESRDRGALDRQLQCPSRRCDRSRHRAGAQQRGGRIAAKVRHARQADARLHGQARRLLRSRWGVLALRGELANAVEVLPQIAKDTARLEVIRASGKWVSSVGVTHPGAHMFATWYNGAAKYWSGDPINDETATGIFILISMLFIQCLNLILPFSWFYGESSAERSSVGEAEPISAPELAAISETGSDAGVMPPISITCSPKAGDLDRMEPASAYDIVNEAADDDTDVISTSDLQADVGSTVEIVSDVKGEMAPTSGMGTDVRQPLEPRQDEGRPATQADVPKQHEAIMQRPEGSGKAFSLDSYDPERVETVRTFIELYCTCDTGVDEVSS
nr:hypothetical protein [Hyphomicrobium sp.]